MKGISNEKILPVCFDQTIRSQGLLAFCISLLAHHPQFEHWYYTDHTTTAFINMPHEFQYVFISQYGDLCALLEHEDYHAKSGCDGSPMLQMMKNRIDEGYYIFAETNEKYIPDTRSWHTGEDFTHTQLVYGYSDVDRVLYCAYYNKLRQYVSRPVKYEDMIQAIETSAPWQPYKFYRYRDVEYPLFWKQIVYDFLSYFDNHDIELLEIPGVIRSPGESGVKRLQECLRNSCENQWFDARAIGTYRENKQVILDKLGYLQLQGLRWPDGVVERYANVSDRAGIVLSLYLKYEITRNVGLIDRMISHMDWILEEERVLYPLIGNCIEEFRVDRQFPN